MIAAVARLGVTAGLATGLVAGLVTLPRWLPGRVVALRMWIFARVDGDDSLPIPGPTVGTSDFLRVYADPAAGGRSRGATLSDLFWYWLSPGAHVHQEHLEAGPRYDEVARATRRILARSRPETEELARRVATRVLDESAGRHGSVRLRDEMMPIWAEFYYELVFGVRCPRHARDLIVAAADDVASALKCVRPRNMRRRRRLTRYLQEHLHEVPHPLPSLLTEQERAWYLQGTIFTTAVVQMSDAMTHLLLLLARHPDVQQRIADQRPDDDGYLDGVINESLRLYPLFGIAHRISTAEIDLDHATIPAGTVLSFNYPAYHRQGPADQLDPDRWRDGDPPDTPFLPFGVTGNRACPARGLAPLTMRVVTREVLRRHLLASSATHTRSIPNRGPCLVVPRGAAAPTQAALRRLAVRDGWEDVWRSVAQLVFGTFMVLDARRQRLAATYFETPSASGPVTREAGCPMRSTA